MLKNYLLTAIRTLARDRLLSFIHILSLAIGISSALVIYLIVHFDLSFENFQPNRERLYRIVTDAHYNGEEFHLAGVPNPLPATARKELTGIAEIAPLWSTAFKVTIAQPGRPAPTVFKQQGRILYTDDHYFKVIGCYTFLAGSGAALGQPFRTVLTASTANAARRAKEIGIRKVLGASVLTIVSLLSKEFVKLLLIAFLIATPAAWWAAHKWLETFAYRIPVHWWIFPIAGGSMIVVALLIMSIRTIRSARANPVKALQSE